jgi:type IV secretory pathway VirB6-like protein
MMFICGPGECSGVFFATLVHHTDSGDCMNKSATMIATALLTFGFAAVSMAADAPKSATPVAEDTTTTPPAKTTHKHKKHKKSTPAPATTK